MGFIKKSWKVIVGVIGFILGLVWFMNKGTNKKVKKLRKDIRDNEENTRDVGEKIKDIKEKKRVTKKKIKDTRDYIYCS